MSRDPGLFLQDIQDSCDKIRLLTAGLDFTEFTEEWRVRDAVLHNLGVIGRAAKRVPEPMRALQPEIPWSHLAGFQEVLAHTYFCLDDVIVWDVIQHQLQPLQEAALALLATLDAPGPAK